MFRATRPSTAASSVGAKTLRPAAAVRVCRRCGMNPLVYLRCTATGDLHAALPPAGFPPHPKACGSRNGHSAAVNPIRVAEIDAEVSAAECQNRLKVVAAEADEFDTIRLKFAAHRLTKFVRCIRKLLDEVEASEFERRVAIARIWEQQTARHQAEIRVEREQLTGTLRCLRACGDSHSQTRKVKQLSRDEQVALIAFYSQRLGSKIPARIPTKIVDENEGDGSPTPNKHASKYLVSSIPPMSLDDAIALLEEMDEEEEFLLSRAASADEHSEQVSRIKEPRLLDPHFPHDVPVRSVLPPEEQVALPRPPKKPQREFEWNRDIVQTLKMEQAERDRKAFHIKERIIREDIVHSEGEKRKAITVLLKDSDGKRNVESHYPWSLCTQEYIRSLEVDALKS